MLNCFQSYSVGHFATDWLQFTTNWLIDWLIDWLICLIMAITIQLQIFELTLVIFDVRFLPKNWQNMTAFMHYKDNFLWSFLRFYRKVLTLVTVFFPSKYILTARDILVRLFCPFACRAWPGLWSEQAIVSFKRLNPDDVPYKIWWKSDKWVGSYWSYRKRQKGGVDDLDSFILKLWADFHIFRISDFEASPCQIQCRACTFRFRADALLGVCKNLGIAAGIAFLSCSQPEL